MASAAAPSFHATEKTTNYARLCRLLVDVGSHILRETFEETWKKFCQLQRFVMSYKNSEKEKC